MRCCRRLRRFSPLFIAADAAEITPLRCLRRDIDAAAADMICQRWLPADTDALFHTLPLMLPRR